RAGAGKAAARPDVGGGATKPIARPRAEHRGRLPPHRAGDRGRGGDGGGAVEGAAEEALARAGDPAAGGPGGRQPAAHPPDGGAHGRGRRAPGAGAEGDDPAVKRATDEHGWNTDEAKREGRLSLFPILSSSYPCSIRVHPWPSSGL